MRILVGLGNPGDQYQKTRHNIGFYCVDLVAKELSAPNWRLFKGGWLAEVSLGLQKHLLFKPNKFMNLSGLPVRALMDYYKVEAQDVCIAADDVYINPGSVRIRQSGGDGGHNGLRSVLENIEPDFWRVRIGVGVYEQHPDKRQSLPALDAYVLQPIPGNDLQSVHKVIDKVVPNLVNWLEQGNLQDETIHC